CWFSANRWLHENFPSVNRLFAPTFRVVSSRGVAIVSLTSVVFRLPFTLPVHVALLYQLASADGAANSVTLFTLSPTDGSVICTLPSCRNCRRLTSMFRAPQSSRWLKPPLESIDRVCSRGSNELRFTK